MWKTNLFEVKQNERLPGSQPKLKLQLIMNMGTNFQWIQRIINQNKIYNGTLHMFKNTDIDFEFDLLNWYLLIWVRKTSNWHLEMDGTGLFNRKARIIALVIHGLDSQPVCLLFLTLTKGWIQLSQLRLINHENNHTPVVFKTLF